MNPNRIRQVGSAAQCGRHGCAVRSPAWRVILGSWQVQVYACAAHLPWAVGLDMLSESVGRAMGWEHGYPNGAGIDLRTTEVTATLAGVVRHDFTRIPAVAAQYPQTATKADGSLTEVWQ